MPDKQRIISARSIIYISVRVLIAVLVIGYVVFLIRSTEYPESPVQYEIAVSTETQEPPQPEIAVPFIRPTRVAPFTADERAFLNGIVYDMLAGYYESAADLLESGIDYLHSIRNTHGFSGFRYRRFFRFNFHVESNINVRMNKVEDGDGVFVFIHYNHMYATRNIRYVEYADGVPNGRFMNKLFQGDFLRWVESGYVVNGRVHGEVLRTEWGFRRDYPIEVLLHYVDGFLQPIGTANERGHKPASIITDPHGERYGYFQPASFEHPWYVTDFLDLWNIVLPYSPWFV